MSKDENDKAANIANKSIAESAALAVQEAANSMRDMNSLSETANGVALAKFIESGDPKFLEALDGVNEIVKEPNASSSGLSVQDAANCFRDMNALLETANGVALANFIESGDSKYLEALNNINRNAKASKENYLELYSSINKTQKDNE